MTDPRLLVGVAVGAAAAWWLLRRRQSNLIAATPYSVKPLKRKGRLGQHWGVGRGGGAWR